MTRATRHERAAVVCAQRHTCPPYLGVCGALVFMRELPAEECQTHPPRPAIAQAGVRSTQGDSYMLVMKHGQHVHPDATKPPIQSPFEYLLPELKNVAAAHLPGDPAKVTNDLTKLGEALIDSAPAAATDAVEVELHDPRRLHVLGTVHRPRHDREHRPPRPGGPADRRHHEEAADADPRRSGAAGAREPAPTDVRPRQRLRQRARSRRRLRLRRPGRPGRPDVRGHPHARRRERRRAGHPGREDPAGRGSQPRPAPHRSDDRATASSRSTTSRPT